MTFLKKYLKEILFFLFGFIIGGLICAYAVAQVLVGSVQ
jgi:hypothetical protein